MGATLTARSTGHHSRNQASLGGLGGRHVIGSVLPVDARHLFGQVGQLRQLRAAVPSVCSSVARQLEYDVVRWATVHLAVAFDYANPHEPTALGDTL
jgi:hypothetical protein